MSERTESQLFAVVLAAATLHSRFRGYSGLDERWVRLWHLLRRTRLTVIVQPEGEADGWELPTLVVRINLTNKPTRRRTTALAKLWHEIGSADGAALCVSYSIANGDTVPILDEVEGVGMYAVAAASEDENERLQQAAP